MTSFDTVIVGSGIGGLICGNILSLEGHKVLILEKNSQIGGCLQTFAHEKVLFDAGVHYLGGLSKGQNLHQIFKYLGLMDKLRLEKMDEYAFDKIIIENDDTEYCFAQGYENFITNLLIYFPNEEKALRFYCEKIKEVCSKFPMYNLETGRSANEKFDSMEIDASAFISSITNDRKLQAVLAGNNMLYVGIANETPFHVHALILNSYIESSWKCMDGGSQIARAIAKNIKQSGGVVRCNAEVTKVEVEEGKVNYLETRQGERYYGNHFISGIHPAKTLEITDSVLLKKAFRHRISSARNSISSFMLNIVLKKDTFPYLKHNYYYHKQGHAWSMADYSEQNWPLGYGLFVLSSSKGSQYAEAISILTYMKYEEVSQWQDTFNTISRKSGRGESYEIFKKKKAEKLLNCVEEKFPDLRNCIQSYHTASPLSYRDYLGTADGSLYGITKDYKHILKSLISPRTKIPNLYFTGQNLHLHGILGAAMSSLITCSMLLGKDDFVEKIKNA